MTTKGLLERIIAEARRQRGIKPYMPHAKLVKDWWPKPKIVRVFNEYMCSEGKTWECYSFSTIGFHPRDPVIPGVPVGECLAYGDSPEKAYDKWCEIFNVWNKKEEWA